MPRLTLTPGSLGYDCYPADPRRFYQDMFEAGFAFQPANFTGVLLQDTTPTADQTGYLWARTSGGVPVNPNPWFFYNGQWVAVHPVPVDNNSVFIYKGSAADLVLKDGGTAAAVTINTGAFWEIDPDFATRVPIGAGTLPSTTVLTVGDTGGEETHVLLSTEMPSHKHDDLVATNVPNNNSTSTAGPQSIESPIIVSVLGTLPTASCTLKDSTTGLTGGDPAATVPNSTVGHNNLQPYRVVNYIRRTSRLLVTTPF